REDRAHLVANGGVGDQVLDGLGRTVHAQRVVVVRAVDVAHGLTAAGPLEAERLDTSVLVLDQEGEPVDLDGRAGRDAQLLHRVERVPDDLRSVRVDGGHDAFPFVVSGLPYNTHSTTVGSVHATRQRALSR